jgi:hypothetical protein
MRRAAAVFGFPAALCAAWTVVAGKDLSWDLLHYHYYVAHSLLGDRMAQDWFAAGAQSYLNPIGYLPFYWMVSAGWHSVLVSMLLAALHGANLALLYLIGHKLLAHHPAARRSALSALAAALGGASAVLWTTIGTSFLDPLLSVPMLAAILLLLGAPPGAAARCAGAAGILFGAAAALKYSNAVFALAGVVLAATLPAASWRARARQVAAYAGGGALAVLVFAGPWLAHLAAEFGNPVFPLFNAVFRSPYAPPASFAAARFAPEDLAAALLLPLRMAAPESMIYTEILAPDLRFAALALALAALPAAALYRRVRRTPAAAPGADGLRLLGFLLLGLAAWILTSANGRYGMLLLLLVGPCLAAVVDRLMPLRWTGLTLGVLLAAQVALCAATSPQRWFLAERWSAHWVPLAVAPAATDQPAIYLMPEVQSMSAVIPSLHPGSSFANLKGQRADSPGWSRVAAQLERGDRPARVLGRGLRLRADGTPRPEVVEVYDWTLVRFGYRIDPARCFAIDWRPDDGDALSRLAAGVALRAEPHERVLSLGACALVRAQRDPREAAEEQRISAVFDRVERECPRVLRGQSSVTERSGAEWLRSYPGLEARLETQSGNLVFVPWFKLQHVGLGLVKDWASDAPPAAACGS